MLVERRERAHLGVIPRDVSKGDRLCRKDALVEEAVHLRIEAAALERGAPVVVAVDGGPGTTVEDRKRVVARQRDREAAEVALNSAQAPASENPVHDAAPVHPLPSLAERQLVNRRKLESMRLVK